MTQDAAQQLRRLLHLIPMLADGEAHSLHEVAELTGEDADDVLKDMRSLSLRYGDPGGFVPDLEIYLEATQVSMRTNHFTRPMRLTAPELCALQLGLAMLRREQVPEEQDTADAARRRLSAALAKLPAEGPGAGPVAAPMDRVHHLDFAAPGDRAQLAALRRGVRERRKLRLTYRRADAVESTTRVICPYGLVASHGAWYVVAHCDDRNAIRIFRLDRIERSELLDARFEVPASFSLDDIVHDGKVIDVDEPTTLRVRYSPRVARWIAEREHMALDADGSLTLDHPLADTAWAVRHVLQYGADAEVLEPERTRREVERRLRDIVAS